MHCTQDSIRRKQTVVGLTLDRVTFMNGLQRAATLASVNSKLYELERLIRWFEIRAYAHIPPAERFRQLMESEDA